VAQDRDEWEAVANAVTNFGLHKLGKIWRGYTTGTPWRGAQLHSFSLFRGLATLMVACTSGINMSKFVGCRH
jgi:hypothetical protein